MCKEILKELLLRNRKDIWLIVIYGVFASLCSLIVPIAVQTFVNTIGFGLLLQPIVILAGVVFFALSISGALGALQVYIMEVMQQRLFAETALEFAIRIPRLKIEALGSLKNSEVASRFLEIVTCQKALAVLILDGVAVSLQILFGMLLLAFYHPYLLVFDLIIVLFILFFFVGLRKSALETSISESAAKFSLVSWLGELTKNSVTFKSFDKSQYALDRADYLASDYVINRKKHFSVLLKQIAGAVFLQVLVSSLLLGVGGWLVIQHQLTLGQLVAAELIVTSVVAGIGKFGKYLESYYDLLASLDKIGHFFELPLEKEGGEKFQECEKNQKLVTVKNIDYLGNFGKKIIDGLSFEIKTDSRIAILGPNGSGKSTLAEIIYGLKSPSSGVIEVNGVDLKGLLLQDIYTKFAYISKVEFFDGTILDNIRVNRADITLNQIKKVTDQLGLTEAIDSLPEGLMTPIVSGSVPLSSGQAQKLMLVRALVGSPVLLILDESLDHLDPESLDQVCHTLMVADAPWAVLLTTRWPHVAEKCGQTLFLGRNKVAQKVVEKASV